MTTCWMVAPSRFCILMSNSVNIADILVKNVWKGRIDIYNFLIHIKKKQKKHMYYAIVSTKW